MGKPLIHSMPDSGTLLRTVLDQFRKVGNRGATVDEIAEAIKTLHQRVSPMVSRLKETGFIGPKGHAKRDSVCGSPMTVYVLAIDFAMELRSAGYSIWINCQCEGHGCDHSKDGDFKPCENQATELIETIAGRNFETCLECAANFPPNLIRASRSIGDKQK